MRPVLAIQGHFSTNFNILVVGQMKSSGPDREILVANFNKKIFFGPNRKSKTVVVTRIRIELQLPSQNFDFFSYLRVLGPIVRSTSVVRVLTDMVGVGFPGLLSGCAILYTY